MDNYGQTEKAGPTIGARILAGLVLAVAAWFLFKVVIGIVAGVAWFVAVIVAIVAIVWALRTLF
jgi:hypothetical protein